MCKIHQESAARRLFATIDGLLATPIYSVYPVSLTVNLSGKIYLLNFIEHDSSGYSEITLYAPGNDGWARIAVISRPNGKPLQVSAMIVDSSGNIQV